MRFSVSALSWNAAIAKWIRFIVGVPNYGKYQKVNEWLVSHRGGADARAIAVVLRVWSDI
jgi:hypothetical protein